MAKKKKHPRKSLGQIAILVLFIVCAAGFIYSTSVVVRNLYDDKKDAAAFDALKESGMNTQGQTQEELHNGYADLKAQNADFDGWLTVSGTPIDYPVMYTPQEPEYYLRRAFDKSDSVSGTPFIGEGCSRNSRSWIIYGHEMENDSMFGTLDNYADKAYWQAHQTILDYTDGEERHYQIFAAIKTSIYTPGTDGFRYYGAVGDITSVVFDEYMNWISQNALYATDIHPVYGNEILTLSTCSQHTEGGRFVVVAYRTQ